MSDDDMPLPPPLPDRLSTDPRSPHHVAAAFEQDVGIRFNGRERHDVEEYCISEGWVRVAAGKARDRHGNPVTIKLKGTVEAFYRGGPSAPDQVAASAESGPVGPSADGPKAG